jgi:hypothetical protein
VLYLNRFCLLRQIRGQLSCFLQGSKALKEALAGTNKSDTTVDYGVRQVEPLEKINETGRLYLGIGLKDTSDRSNFQTFIIAWYELLFS